MKKLIILIGIILFSIKSYSVTYIMGNFPVDYQFYGKNVQDSGFVLVSGIIQQTGIDSVQLRVKRDGVAYKQMGYVIGGVNNTNFSWRPSIFSELHEYKFELYSYVGSTPTLLQSADNIVCGRVLVILGQSNPAASLAAATYTNEYCRSIGSHVYPGGPDYPVSDTAWGLANGNSQSGDYIGPLMTGVIGIRLQQYIKESYGKPICVINSAVGGSSIEFWPPNISSRQDRGTAWGANLYKVKQAHLENFVDAIIWYQGESNSSYSNDPLYGVNGYNYYFSYLCTQWLIDFPNMSKIYVCQVNVGRCSIGDQGYAEELREAQRQLPVTTGNTKIVMMSTISTGYSYDGCHYFTDGATDGYFKIAAKLIKLIGRDFYNDNDTIAVRPPNIIKAYINSPTNTQLTLIFDQDHLRWGNDTLGHSLFSQFYISNGTNAPTPLPSTSKVITGNTIVFTLSSATPIDSINYGRSYYNGTTTLNVGPFLTTQRDVGALTFFDFPVEQGIPATDSTSLGYVYVTVKLVNSVNNADLHGTVVRYGSGNTWLHFGSGTTETHMYISPGSYFFKVTYAGITDVVYQNITSTPTVTFQTHLVTVELRNAANTEDLGGTPEYWNGTSWTSFGGGITPARMELLNVRINYRVTYGFASNIINQTQGPVVTFQTKAVTLKLLDQTNSNTPIAGISTYAITSSYSTFGTGTTTVIGEVFPRAYYFKVTKSGKSATIYKNITDNTTLNFYWNGSIVKPY